MSRYRLLCCLISIFSVLLLSVCNVLAEDKVINREPVWSPDGQHIAFMSNRDSDDFDVWVMNADGSNPLNLTNGLPEYLHLKYSPLWSPDGQSVAFHIASFTGSAIWKIKRDGTNLVNLSSRENMFDATVSGCWVSDNQIIFSSNRSGAYSIWSMDANGDNAVNLTPETTTVKSALRCSPDGKRIIYYEEPEDEERSATKIMWLDNASSFPVIDQLLDPYWSPSGRYILYADEFVHLALLEIDSKSNPRLITGNAALAFQPVGWLSDEQVVFKLTQPENISLWKMNLFSPADLISDELPPEARDFALSPDGKYIAFAIQTPNGSDIWRIGIDGTDLTNLTTPST
jgi:Tol biopolymer transport system component